MKQRIDLATWKRREYFEFFGGMDDPFWGTVVPTDFTECYREAKAAGASFFLYSLHRILTAVNRTEALRYRIENHQVVCYDRIHVSSTIGREDGGFGYGFFEYFPDREEFIHAAKRETERVKAAEGLCLDANERIDLILFSALPWFAFTEMKHARSINPQDSVPRISTGRLARSENRLEMPVSLDVHHGLVDGQQAGEFFAQLKNGK